MSNPVVTIGNTIPGPAEPQVIRRTFTRIVYDSQDFYTYALGEYSSSFTGMAPEDQGQRFYMFVPLDNSLGAGGSSPGVQPDIVSDESWEILKKSASSFVTGVKSVMPKIIIPSKILIDNGLLTPDEVFVGTYDDGGGGAWADLFNWELLELNGTPISPTNFYEMAQVGAFFGSQYITNKAKDDSSAINELTLKLRNGQENSSMYPPPDGASHDLRSDYDGNGDYYVGGGAFVLLLNVVPGRPAVSGSGDVANNPWSWKMEFGDVTIEISEAGAAKVTVAGEDDGNTVTVNLSDAKAKEGPAQQQHIDDKQPYAIFVYPVWNGIVVSSGVQEGRGSSSNLAPVLSTSYFIPKLKSASILVEPYSSGFNPSEPDEVEVGTDGGAIEVDFGKEMFVTAKNVKFEMAYLPCFFSKDGWFDEWFVGSDDVEGVVDFDYEVYPIWTKNGSTNIDLNPPPTVEDTTYPGPVPNSSYRVVPWRLENDSFDRIGGEVFGSFLETVETRDFPVRNDNGNFNLLWSGGTPGDISAGNWQKYVQSFSVTISDDGSNGSLVIDKFGVAGQDAVALQSIGAITIDATGGYGTNAGTLFKGLAMGVANTKSTDGATWTIPLIGLEKKLEDIALINVPYFDGEPMGVAVDFLTKYGGIIANMSGANPSVVLGLSEDINVPRFDWKSGTSIKSALDEVMEDTLHWYVVRDGYIYFYELSEINGLPLALGTNWEGSYPGTKIVSIDGTPDFEDLRNEVMAIALQQVPEGQGTEIENLPLFPLVELRNVSTVPDVPWARSLIRDYPGALTQPQLEDRVDRLVALFSTYIITGRTSIPGNANIKPYDTWGSTIIKSVTHNVDLVGKVWTTDLEFWGQIS